MGGFLKSTPKFLLHHLILFKMNNFLQKIISDNAGAGMFS